MGNAHKAKRGGVARMQRLVAEFADRLAGFPDSSSLHPGYVCL